MDGRTERPLESITLESEAPRVGRARAALRKTRARSIASSGRSQPAARVRALCTTDSALSLEGTGQHIRPQRHKRESREQDRGAGRGSGVLGPRLAHGGQGGSTPGPGLTVRRVRAATVVRRRVHFLIRLSAGGSGDALRRGYQYPFLSPARTTIWGARLWPAENTALRGCKYTRPRTALATAGWQAGGRATVVGELATERAAGGEEEEKNTASLRRHWSAATPCCKLACGWSAAGPGHRRAPEPRTTAASASPLRACVRVGRVGAPTERTVEGESRTGNAREGRGGAGSGAGAGAGRGWRGRAGTGGPR